MRLACLSRSVAVNLRRRLPIPMGEEVMTDRSQPVEEVATAPQ
jgi:hypothetical protein